MDLKTATQHAIGMREKGETATPNVEVVRMMGVRLITASLSAEIRQELRDAVKAGRLGHLKKDGRLPEAFFHPNSRGNAITLRERKARETVEALRGVMAPPRVMSCNEEDGLI
jgi:hypothetical protein